MSAFHAIWGDPQVIGWGPANDEAASRRILEKAWANCAGCPDGLGWFAVVERESDRICGNVFLQPHRYGKGWELGYHFATWAQGRGYATEASRSLIDFAFSIGIDRVVALVLADNAPSQRVCEKLGLRKTGTLVHADLLHDVLEAGPGRGGPSPIVFDLGGVVVRWDPEAILAQAVEDPGARAAVRTGLLQHPDWQALDRGTLAPEDAIERAARRTGLPEAPFARLLALVPDALAPVPEVIELLEGLHGGGHTLFWLSNMHHDFIDHLERAHDFWSLFEGGVASCRVRLVKPEPAIYEHLLATFGLDAKATVFVDDVEENVEAAEAVGLQTVLFESTDQCREALARLGPR